MSLTLRNCVHRNCSVQVHLTHGLHRHFVMFQTSPLNETLRSLPRLMSARVIKSECFEKWVEETKKNIERCERNQGKSLRIEVYFASVWLVERALHSDDDKSFLSRIKGQQHLGVSFFFPSFCWKHSSFRFCFSQSTSTSILSCTQLRRPKNNKWLYTFSWMYLVTCVP